MPQKKLLIIGGFITLIICAFLWNSHQNRILEKLKLELQHQEKLELMSNCYELTIAIIKTLK